MKNVKAAALELVIVLGLIVGCSYALIWCVRDFTTRAEPTAQGLYRDVKSGDAWRKLDSWAGVPTSTRAKDVRR